MTSLILGHSAHISNPDSDIYPHSRRECGSGRGPDFGALAVTTAISPDDGVISAESRAIAGFEGFGSAEGVTWKEQVKSVALTPADSRSNPDDIQGLSPDSNSENFVLQDLIAKRVLGAAEFDFSNPDWELLNSLPKVVKCGRFMIGGGSVSVYANGNGNTHFEGLQVCNSVWACPVCAEKIMAKRREEIAQCIDWAYENGLKAMMVTFTQPHNMGQSLDFSLGAQAAALRTFRSGKPWKAFLESAGSQGFVRALEVTFSKANGWHAHTHELYFVAPGTDAVDFRAFCSKRWEAACSKAGLIPRGKLRAFRKQAVHVLDNMSSSAYLAKAGGKSKWGAEKELANAAGKHGRWGSLKPFQLITEDWPRFLEYMDSMKGKAAVFFSPGLKDKVGIEKVSDKTISEGDGECDASEKKHIVTFDSAGWSFIRRKGLRYQVLAVAKAEGLAGLARWEALQGIALLPEHYDSEISRLRDECEKASRAFCLLE